MVLSSFQVSIGDLVVSDQLAPLIVFFCVVVIVVVVVVLCWIFVTNLPKQ